jgi:hypothetical protein
MDNNHFPSLVNKIYPHELQLYKANTSDKQANFKKKGYQHDILQRSAGLVINPSTVDHYAYLFGCTTVAGV